MGGGIYCLVTQLPTNPPPLWTFALFFFPTADNFVAKSLYWSLSPSPGVLVLVYLLLPLTESLLFLSLPTPNSSGSPGPTLSVRDAQHRVLGCFLGLNLIPFP